MIELSSLGVFALALAVAAGVPGPTIAAFVGQVLSRGIGSVMPFIAAMWVGEAIWITAAVLGLGAIAQTFQGLFLAIKYAGVVYLLYLAWRMWTAATVIAEPPPPLRGDKVRLFMTGMAVTLGNPKIMLFYVALMPSIIDVSAVTPQGLVTLIAVAIGVLAMVDLVWGAAAHQARRWLRSPRAVRVGNRIGATAMGGAAIAIAVK